MTIYFVNFTGFILCIAIVSYGSTRSFHTWACRWDICSSWAHLCTQFSCTWSANILTNWSGAVNLKRYKRSTILRHDRKISLSLQLYTFITTYYWPLYNYFNYCYNCFRFWTEWWVDECIDFKIIQVSFIYFFFAFDNTFWRINNASIFIFNNFSERKVHLATAF